MGGLGIKPYELKLGIVAFFPFLGVLGVDPFYSVIPLYGRIYTVWYGNYSVRI